MLYGLSRGQKLSSFYPFPFYVGPMFVMRRFQLIRHCGSSPDSSLSDKSFLMLSNHLRVGLPLLLFNGTSIGIYITITLLPTHYSSLLNTCPYHFKLFSCTFLDISPTFAVPILLSFLILFSLVTPLIQLNHLIYATYCELFTDHVYWFLPQFSLLHTCPVLHVNPIFSQTHPHILWNPNHVDRLSLLHS